MTWDGQEEPVLRVEVFSQRECSYDGWKTVFTALDVGTGTKVTSRSHVRAVRRLIRQLKRQARHQRRYHAEAH